ncbi:MAG: zinc-ribbon domain-containing protein [Archaeoglobaceae archaeon]
MPKCPKCGEDVSSTWRYCRACGANLLGYRRRNYALAIFGIVFVSLGFVIPSEPNTLDKFILYAMGSVFLFFGIVLEYLRVRQERSIKKRKKS